MIHRFIAVTLIFAITGVCHADSISDLHTSLIAKKREQIAAALDLNKQDNSEFWEVYDKYEKEQYKHSTDVIKLIRKFNDKYESGLIELQSMLNMQAEFFRVEGRILQTKQNYAEFFSNVLSNEDVFRFYQIETKLDALIRSKIAEKSPLIAPGVNLD